MASCDIGTSDATVLVQVTALPDQLRRLLFTRYGTLDVIVV